MLFCYFRAKNLILDAKWTSERCKTYKNRFSGRKYLLRGSLDRFAQRFRREKHKKWWFWVIFQQLKKSTFWRFSDQNSKLNSLLRPRMHEKTSLMLRNIRFKRFLKIFFHLREKLKKPKNHDFSTENLDPVITHQKKNFFGISHWKFFQSWSQSILRDQGMILGGFEIFEKCSRTRLHTNMYIYI